MAGYTSNSKDAVILKVLVDYACFKKLKEAEKELEKCREAEIKKLQFVKSDDQYGAGTEMVVDQSAADQKKTDEKSRENGAESSSEENNQIGKGPSKPRRGQTFKQQHLKQQNHNLTEDKIRKIFREEIHRYFSKPPSNLIEQVKNIKIKDVLQHIPYVNQLIGNGNVDPDITPNVIQSNDMTSMHNNNEGGFYSQLGRSKPIILRENDFLKLIPIKFHSRAKKLLDYFENHSMNVSWNPDGNLTIANEFIPNSNIYDVFTELYSLKPKLNLPGYITLANYLLNAGLGHLFVRSGYWFITRRLKNFTPSAEEQTGAGQLWYYIEDN